MPDTDIEALAAPEQWRLVVENHDYEVSDLGNVRRATPGKNTAPGRPVKAHLNKRHNRYMVVLCWPKKENRPNKNCTVHRLVAAAFLPPVEGCPDVHHIDFDPTNNRLDNLEWTSHANNLAVSRSAGRWPVQDKTGTKNGHAKLDEEDVRNIRGLSAAGYSGPKLGAMFGITSTCIYDILTGRTWRHVL